MDLEYLKKKYLAIPEGSLMQAGVIRDFVEENVFPRRLDLEGGFHRDKELALKTKVELEKDLVDLSIVRGMFPVDIGGVGMPWRMEFLYPTFEELARGDCGLLLDVQIPAWVFMAATFAPNKKVLEEYGSKFTGDEMVHACLSMVEPGGGANICDETMEGKTLRTTARLDGDYYVINGQKLWPSGCGEASYLMTVTTTDPNLGDEGICLLYHPAKVEGFFVGPNFPKMGMIYTDYNSWIRYDNVRVHKDYRAAGPGRDAELWRDALALARLMSAPIALGPAQAGLEIVMEHTKNRRVGNKAVRELTMHAGIIADMAITIEAARSYAINVCRMFDDTETFGPWRGAFLTGKASGSKVMACDGALQVLNKSMELMGAIGYTQNTPLEKYLRDVKIVQIWEGGNQLARLDMARSFYPFKTSE
jgi:alkylation response protein AidB-like acyl-CoA dehydrogenase